MRATAAGSALLMVVLTIFLVRPAPIADLDSRIGDVLTGWAGHGRLSGQVAIVEIDEKSLDQLGRWPWPRNLISRLTGELQEGGAAAVALDMMFPQPDGSNDVELAGTIAGKPVVTGFALKFDGAATAICPEQSLPLAITGPGDADAALFHATGAVCSVPVISAAARANGFLNASPDHDGLMRHIPLVAEFGTRYYPSLALAAVNTYWKVSALRLATGSFGPWRMHLDHNGTPLEAGGLLRLRFRGARRRFPYVSAADFLAHRVPPDLLRGRIVVVGGTASGMDSPVITPADSQFPAVEIQATAIDNLLQGDAFYRSQAAVLWEFLLSMLACAIAVFALVRFHFLWGTLTVLTLTALAWAGCAWAVASSGSLVSPLPATATLFGALPAFALARYVREKYRADQAQLQLVETQRQSREVLEESEQRYRRLVENVNDAIIMDDAQGRLVFANRRFREWFGLRQEDVSNLVLENYVAPDWRGELRERHDRRMRGESVPDHFEFEGIRPDGSRIWIEALVTAVEDGGRIVGSQAALRDTTERKRMESQYLQAQKMESIGRLAGGVAHDFNNLLTVINGYSAMLLSRMGAGDSFAQEIKEIHRAGERAADLTQKLLAFSRKQLVRPKPLDLNTVVLDSKKMLERLIGENIQLVTRLAGDLSPVLADAGQMHQVLMNLVVNARDAMSGGGAITIETRNSSGASGRDVYLAVSDTGTGLSDEVKKHLFEPFFTTKDQGKGTGLGLATIYGIVNQNGGRIEVSSALGRGTTFHIYLPGIQPAAPEPAARASGAAALGGSETILVVEDQDSVRQFTGAILEGFGYQVLQAANGPDAITLAERHHGPIDLLITDIVLPVMDGRVLAGKLKELHAETRVLFVSGYSEEAIGHADTLQDELAFLPKPFTSDGLAQRVREILNRGDEQRRAASQE